MRGGSGGRMMGGGIKPLMASLDRGFGGGSQGGGGGWMPPTHCIHMRGLPFRATQGDIAEVSILVLSSFSPDWWLAEIAKGLLLFQEANFLLYYSNKIVCPVKLFWKLKREIKLNCFWDLLLRQFHKFENLW
jgi:hypothetical protein